MKNQLLKKLGTVLVIASSLSACGNTEKDTVITKAPEKKLNILYIMSDDHTRQAIGAYGGLLSSIDPTPNIDKLASEGTRFDNVFVTNSICTPSRATIITGQYSQTNGALDLDGQISADKQYLPKLMSQAGYQTAIIGKWHLKKEPKAFDYYKVLPNQGKYFDPVFRDKNAKGKWPNNKVQSKGHSSDVITDLSIDWLSHRDKNKPFFLMHHYKSPHDMFENAPRYDEYLANVEIPEPASLYSQPNWGSKATKGENDSLVHEIGTSVSKRNPRRNMGIHMNVDQSLSDKKYTHESYQHYLKRYLRTVKGVDDNLARLFNYLKETGEWDNTVIIYTGDQGILLGEHDLIDKRWMYEPSLRMPFIVRYPGKTKAPKVNGDLINNTDFAPMMLDIAGVETPEYMQGQSFANVFDNKPLEKWREATYYRYWMHRAHHDVPSHFGVRSKEYKLIFFYGTHYDATPVQSDVNYAGHNWSRKDGVIPSKTATPAGWEFYDLKNDPEELHNRYDDPQYKEVIAKLKAEMLKQREAYNETDANYPHIQKVIDKHWND
ncbi:sulfatase [Thalassotalea sp. SU-HH00458]|uniref:sulfatase family protein n=1 Tax=Thalassotalea sp. SU-HH00458 TaxID=3127657 RepID=UPI003106FAD4